MKPFIYAGLAVLFSTSSLSANNLAVCGESSGYGFYPKAGIAATQPGSGQWTPDAISGGRFSLTENNGEQLDILVTDAMGRVYSSTQEGAKVAAIGSTENSLTVLVAYPNLIETYTFLRDAEGQAEAMWTTNKWGTPVAKVAAYRADCTYFVR
jgi:hypothetical protein